MKEMLLFTDTGITDIDHAHGKSKVFGELVKLASPVLAAYHSDLYHDAIWLEANLKGVELTFFFGFDESGTNIGHTTEYIIREHQFRIRVWIDGSAVRMSVEGA